jgi:hypothetical protein
MGYTRRDFVNGALEEIGLASYVYDATAEQLTGAMRRLDAMMAEWNAKGIRIGYPIPSGPNTGSIDDETSCPDSAWEAVTCNLALRIAPSYGKQVMAATMTNAKRAYNTLLNLHATPIEAQLPQMPAGAGNKPWMWNADPFTTRPEDRLAAGNDSLLEL